MLVEASKAHIEKLTAISKAAFDTDILVGDDEIGGPPGYDSVQWHAQMMQSGNLFSYFVDDVLIGGAVLFKNKKEPTVLYIGRIFIAPQYHRMGYGLKLMRQIEKMYPEVSVFRLETPSWNVRTHSFYEKCGYHELLRDHDSVYYQKTSFER